MEGREFKVQQVAARAGLASLFRLATCCTCSRLGLGSWPAEFAGAKVPSLIFIGRPAGWLASSWLSAGHLLLLALQTLEMSRPKCADPRAMINNLSERQLEFAFGVVAGAILAAGARKVSSSLADE